MSVINSIPLIAAGDDGYQISRSVRLRSSASAYFNRTPASASNRQRFTWSGWVKRGALSNGVVFSADSSGGGTATESNNFNISFISDTLTVGWSGGNWRVTSQVFRDPSAWYHLVVAFDTTQATAANRVAVYVNGSAVTAFSTNTAPTLNVQTAINNTVTHRLGNYSAPTNILFDGYLTEVNFIDGQALTASNFGETDSATGVWKAKKYTGTYGTNGFYMNFSDNSAATAAAIGKDYSGNGNNWTPNNISVTAGVTYDSMIDVPTMWADGGNGRGNYCVLNPLDWNTTAFTLTNGNLTWTSTTTANGSTRGTMGMTTGKWYWEVTATSVGGGTAGVGVAKDGSANFGSGQALYGSNLGNKYIDGVNTAYGATWATGNVIGIAYDADAGQVTFYKDNASQGAITLSGYAGVNVCPAVADGSSLAFTLDANFGQRPFAYTPPTGFKALNTQNLPDATIKKGNAYFDATLYTGNGSTQSIVNAAGFQPDLVWAKTRSNAYHHALVDSVRGATNQLQSSSTAAEFSGGVASLNSNGFSVNNNYNENNNGMTYVAWQWKAGGTAVSNTSGSITSQVSANTTAGFSVVTWTGPSSGSFTVGHGLGVAPSMYIVKRRSNTSSWGVWQKNLAGGTSYLLLEGTAAQAADSTVWTSAPSSSVLNLGSAWAVGGPQTFVAYCFSEVAGYSKFGSYTGNGSTDGPFVFTNFQPRFIMVKRTDTTGDWEIKDTARDTVNTASNTLFANLSNAEAAQNSIDVLSNGFKLRGAGTNNNASGGTYIYVAFASNPFKNSSAR